MTRQSGGWTTAPLLSPAQVDELARPGKQTDQILFRHYDASSGRTLWTVLYDGAGGDIEAFLYLEESGGSFVELGREAPGLISRASADTEEEEASFAVSKGMSHIVFRTQYQNPPKPGERWPGDTTVSGVGTLFETTDTYAREPLLVGVKNQHRLQSNTEAELISSCGTYLGANEVGERRGALADEGHVVIFTAAEKRNDCTGPEVNEIYARIGGEHTVAISEPSREDCEDCNTSTGLGAAEFRGASTDGTKVYFTTAQELLPGVKGMGLYVYDFSAPSGHRVALVSAGGGGEPGVEGVVRVSEDGSHVYFVATGVLSGRNAEGKEPTGGSDNLYAYQVDQRFPSGHVAFVATLASGDQADWETYDQDRPSAVTPNGEYFVFVSSADLAGGDTSDQPQLFGYEATGEALARISVGQRSSQSPSGYNEDGNTTSELDGVTIPAPFNTSLSNAAGDDKLIMSDNGHEIFFQSANALTPQAGDNVSAGRACTAGLENPLGECLYGGHELYVQNVYEFHWSEHMSDGNVYLISGGRDASPYHEGEVVQLTGTDPSGADVFFTTTESLVPQDTDSQVDTYDARVEGGFAAPTAPAFCGVESCEGSSSQASGQPAPASASWPAGEDLAPAVGSSPAGVAPRRLTRAQLLTRALKSCRARSKKRRRGCEAAARKQFATGTASSRRHR
jgi:hypothetical protein